MRHYHGAAAEERAVELERVPNGSLFGELHERVLHRRTDFAAHADVLDLATLAEELHDDLVGQVRIKVPDVDRPPDLLHILV